MQLLLFASIYQYPVIEVTIRNWDNTKRMEIVLISTSKF